MPERRYPGGVAAYEAVVKEGVTGDPGDGIRELVALKVRYVAEAEALMAKARMIDAALELWRQSKA